MVSFSRSSTFVSPGSKSITPPPKTGGWFSRGVTLIGSTSVATRPFGSVALVPSVTSNDMEAGPKYLSAEVNLSVWSSTTGSWPLEWVARTPEVSASRTFLPPMATT